MEGRKKYLKGLAFVPAIVLGGGFVGGQAGVFQMLSKPEPKLEPHPSGREVPDPPAPQPAANSPATEREPVFLPGSKSIAFQGVTLGLTPAEDEDIAPGTLPKLTLPVWLQPARVAPKEPPVFLPGSKSFRPVPFVEPPDAPKP